MVEPAEIAGDIAAAGSAIAGLLLVYVGSLSASFDRFQAQERKTVAASFRRRIWFAFVGLAFCIAAVALAVLGKWLAVACMILTSLALLLLGLCWVLVTGVLTALEIK